MTIPTYFLTIEMFLGGVYQYKTVFLRALLYVDAEFLGG